MKRKVAQGLQYSPAAFRHLRVFISRAAELKNNSALLAIKGTMPSRLSKISPDQADAETRQVFESFFKERGNVPNMFRTVAHRPEIMKTMNAHFRAVMSTGTVDRRLKEIIAVRVSYINHCEY